MPEWSLQWQMMSGGMKELPKSVEKLNEAGIELPSFISANEATCMQCTIS